jgi:hypothetical protein
MVGSLSCNARHRNAVVSPVPVRQDNSSPPLGYRLGGIVALSCPSEHQDGGRVVGLVPQVHLPHPQPQLVDLVRNDST